MKNRWTVVVSAALAALVVLVWSLPVAAKDPQTGNGRVLEKRTFIHYRKGTVKPPNVGKPSKPSKDEGYYTYLANGAKWKTREAFRLNLTCGENTDGTLNTLIEDAVEDAIAEWETPDGQALDIFKDAVEMDSTVTYQDGAYRDYNTISFGANRDPNVIAVTRVWGYFTGKPSTREIVEAHIQFNDAYIWGDAEADSSVMDVQNIFTHELGHAAGMGDLYETVAAQETMFGYSTEGETKKRTLDKGDTTGIIGLYK